jgi:hypothetical protein
MINELFPDTLSEKTQLPTVNAVGQELKFQAFEYENVESVGASGKTLTPAKKADLKSWHKGDTGVSVREGLDAEPQSFDVEGQISNDEKEWSCILRTHTLEHKAPSLGAWDESTESSVLNPAPGAIIRTRLRELHDGEATGTLPVSDPDRAHISWSYRGIRAGKKTREAANQKWPDSVPSPASDAGTVVEDWVLQTRATAEMLTGNAKTGQVSNRQDSLASPLKCLEPLRSRKWKVHHGMEHDNHSRAESLISQRSGQRSYGIATGEWPEPVDPCSLSRAELDVAISELLSTIQSDIGFIHPDRLKRATRV